MKTFESAELAQKEQTSILEAARIPKSELSASQMISFGSKAHGTGDIGSDIDLLMLASCPVTTALRTKVSDRLATINPENDAALTSITVLEQDWPDGLIRHMLIHSDIERDGCEI